MKKQAFYIFALIVALTTFGVILYVESRHFAGILKNTFAKQIESQLGIAVDFDYLGIKAIPPTISLIRPKVREIKSNNIVGIPINSLIEAEKIGVTFRVLQEFGVELFLNKIFVEGATIKIRLPKPSGGLPSNKNLTKHLLRPFILRLKNKIKLKVREIEIKNTSIDVEFTNNQGHENFLRIRKIQNLSLLPDQSLSLLTSDMEGIAWRIGDSAEELDAFVSNLEIRPKGIKALSLDVQKKGITVHVSGELAGDITDIPKMDAKIHLIARTELQELRGFFPEIKSFTGKAYSEIDITGVWGNYTFKSTLSIDDFRYSSWEMDRVFMKFQYSKNKIAIQHIDFLKNNGALRLKEMTIDLDKNVLNNKFNFHFHNVDFHSFAGDLNKSLKNLHMDLNGELSLQIKARKRDSSTKVSKILFQEMLFQEMLFRPNLKMKSLRLNKRKKKKGEPTKNIFNLKEVALRGDMILKDERLSMGDVDLSIGKDKLKILGFYDGTTGFNLSTQGNNIDLNSSVGKISTIPIKGLGMFGVFATGVLPKVFLDFKFNLNDAEYTKLKLGKCKGVVTLDTLNSIITLKKIRGDRPQGFFTLDGIINIDKTEKLNLHTKFRNIELENVFKIFTYQTKNISWIPYGIKGTVDGDIAIKGTYTNPEKTFDVSGTMKSRSLLYLSEKLSSLEGSVGLKNGTYFAKDIRARKYSSIIEGRISHSLNSILDYQFNISRGRLRDIDHFVSMGIPMNAAFSASGWGRGPTHAIEGGVELEINGAEIGSIKIPSMSSSMSFSPETINFLAESENLETDFSLKIGRRSGSKSSLYIQTKGSGFSFMACIINPIYCNDESTSVLLDGSMESNWTAGNWKKMNGTVTWNKASLYSKDVSLSIENPIQASIKKGFIKFDPIFLIGQDSNLSINTKGLISGDNFTLKAKGDLPLKLIQFLTPVLNSVTGVAKVNTIFKGSVDKLNMQGTVKLENAGMHIEGINPGVLPLNGELSFSKNRVTMKNMNGSFGQGSVSIDGYADFFLHKLPVFNLNLNLNNNKFKFYPVNLAQVDNGTLSLTGKTLPYSISGTLKMKKIIIRRNFDLDDRKSLKGSRYFPELILEKSNLYTVNIKSISRNGVVVKNDLFDSEFKGEISISNNFKFPKITGKMSLVNGNLLFRNVPFRLKHMEVSLVNLEEFNPSFSLIGASDLGGYSIKLFTAGNIDNYKITLSSSPELPQEDILSLLAFGFVEKNNNRSGDNSRLSTITYAEVGSMLLDQLKINEELQTTGVNIQISPTIIQNEANIVRPKSVPEFAVPKILLKTRLLNNMDASFGTTVGVAQGEEFDANIEYHLSQKISITSIYKEKPDPTIKGSRSSFGADFKFKWNFK